MNKSSTGSGGATRIHGINHPIEVDGIYYIPSDALLAGIKKIVLKENELFAILDASGELPRVYEKELGVYFRDTRYLDTWEMYVNGEGLTLLATESMPDVCSYIITLTNKDMPSFHSPERIPRDRLGIRRVLSISEEQFFEHTEIMNFDQMAHRLKIERRVGSQFNDIFEVRGSVRQARGKIFAPTISKKNDTLLLTYEGINQKSYKTTFFSDLPFTYWEMDQKNNVIVEQEVFVPSHSSFSIRSIVSCQENTKFDYRGRSFLTLPIGDQISIIQNDSCTKNLGPTQIQSDSELINLSLKQSQKDIACLLSRREGGTYPDAGIPWFCAPFGRDGLITAYQLLPWYSSIAVGVLNYVFTHLGQKSDPFTEEEPGRVFHEMRYGEMANLKEVPFVPYYGSVDATPLSVILLTEYIQWTGDIQRLKEWWEPCLLALSWLRQKLKESENGFLTYQRHDPRGLSNHGWKDSHDSVMHADGTLAPSPIALCEVQGYTYRALNGGASLALLLEKQGLAHDLADEAKSLKDRFRNSFWDEAKQYLYLARDGLDRPVAVRSSNMGQCLWGGILDDDVANAISTLLTSNDFFSGHGIRTLSSQERAYNPLSYHNGSVWPHDNALVSEGFQYYAKLDQLRILIEGVFNLLKTSEDFRLPELVCGFPRNGDSPPVPYEVACKPQAWAAGSLFLFLKSCLGMTADFRHSVLKFKDPFLPSQLKSLQVRRLRVGENEVDFEVRRTASTANIEILSKSRGLTVITEK